MDDIGELLKQSVANHGHLCPGQVLGVRLAMLGCREVGIDDPKSSRDLICTWRSTGAPLTLFSL